MYRGLYKLADIGETGSQLARMFALLPYQEIDRNFTVMFFQGFLKINETLGEALGRLVKFGWLEDTGNGYRMHPVIAESLCTKDFSEAEFQSFWERAQKCFFPKQAPKDEDPRMEEIAWLVFQGISRVQGPACGTGVRGCPISGAACSYVRENPETGKKMCTDFQ